MSKTKLYISFDVETDGSSPLVNNMLSIGFSGLLLDGTEIFSSEYNIKPLEGHQSNPDTMNFWLKEENREAWLYIHQNQLDYDIAFLDLSNKLITLSVEYDFIFVASPSCFDWMFFKSYYDLAKNKYKDMYDIGYKCECASTMWKIYKIINPSYAIELKKVKKEIENLPNTTNLTNTTNLLHTALYDARIQGKQHLLVINYFI
jgi:hypothetical protein